MLREIGVDFDTLVPDVDEALRDYLPPADRVLALAEDKARAAAALDRPGGHRLIFAADTLVCLPGAGPGGSELALGKPEDLADARRMIRLLEGRAHLVRTGIALLDLGTDRARTARSDSTVVFSRMVEEEIEVYLESGEWAGVAGAYRIQALASLYIERLEGSWSGVVGLPMRELYVILRSAGIRIPVLASSRSEHRSVQGKTTA